MNDDAGYRPDGILSRVPGFSMNNFDAALTAITDNKGRTLHVRSASSRDLGKLAAFYDDFHPKRSAQGLPPGDGAAVRRWLTGVLEKGHHIIAEQSERPVAHLMLIPLTDDASAVELATFVHQSFRSGGVASQLNKAGAHIARAAGYERMWLSVEPSNKAAIRSYERAGFSAVPGSLWTPEVEMEVNLCVPASRELR